MDKKTLSLIGMVVGAMAAFCFLVSTVGIAWLYFTGHPALALIPQPLMVTLLGGFVFSVPAIVCYGAGRLA